MVGRVVGKLIEWLWVWPIDTILVFAGVLSLAIGLGLWNAQRPIEGGVLTTGRVVDQVTKVDSDGERMTYPVIEFTDGQERTHRFENEIGGGGVGGIQGRVGQVVTVRYDPEKPSRAQWADQPGQEIPVLVAALGAVALLVEVGLVARRLFRRRAPGGEAAHPVL